MDFTLYKINYQIIKHAADGVASENIREFLNEYKGDMPSPDNMDAG